MLWLFEMYEEGKKCSDWPAINYQLDTFGKDDVRVIDLSESEVDYRIMAGEMPGLPGVNWVKVPYSGPGPQPVVPMAMRPSPNFIDYHLCNGRWHVHIFEHLHHADSRRVAMAKKIDRCATDHVQHVERVAVVFSQLPISAQRAFLQGLRMRSLKEKLADAITGFAF